MSVIHHYNIVSVYRKRFLVPRLHEFIQTYIFVIKINTTMLLSYLRHTALLIFTALLGILYPETGILAQDGFHFNHLTTKDGLSDNAIWLIYQDSEGFIWIGTNDGVYRYDGYKVETIQRNFLYSSRRGHSVTSLAEDSVKKHMWIGTECGLFVWNARTGSMNAFEWPEKYKNLTGVSISALCMDSKGKLYIGTENHGVYVLTTKDSSVHPFIPIPEMSLKDIHTIKLDNNGYIWMVTYRNGVIRYQPNNNRTERYGQNLSVILSCREDRQGNLWYGTFQGLYKQGPQDKQPQPVNLLKTNNELQLSINDIVEYDDNTLALATSDGLIFYNTQLQRTIHLKSDKRIAYTLNNDYLNKLFIDREHTLWIATYFGGANYLPQENRNFSTFDFLNYQIQGNIVSAFAEDRLGHVWIGTEDGGLACYTPSSKTVTNYNPKLYQQHVPNFYNIHALMTEGDWLYIGMSTGGVDRLNIINGKSEHWKTGFLGNLSSNTIYSFGKSHDRRIWIGTTLGLNYYDPDNEQIKEEAAVPSKRINCIIEDSLRNLWICGEELGVWYKDTTNTWHDFNQEYPLLPTRKIYTLAQEGHTIFIGTESYGVFCYDIITGHLNRLSHSEANDKIVYCIVPEDHYLWISIESGLIHHNLYNGEYKFYSANQDLKTEQMNLNAGLRLKNGTLLFGTLGGLNGFRTADLVSNRQIPRTVLTRLYVNNSPVIASEDNSILKNTLTNTSHITLNNSHSHIGIQFAVLSYSGPAQNRFRYRLQPFDDDWRETDAVTPIAHYTNLPAGNYTFEVIGANSDGVWSQEPCTLSLTVLPPWWLAWYMKTFYTLLTIAFIMYLFYRLKRKHQKEIELLNIQRAKELYQTKMDFFTHLIHEIRTPLTLIIAPIELMLKSMKDGEERNNLLLAQRNSHRLLNLVNQLMDMRKIDKEAFSLHLETVELKNILSKLCTDFSAAAQTKGIRIVCHWPENAHTRIRADKEAMTKVFSNLLSNAMKFTKDLIEVSLSNDKDQWIVAIADNGQGIDKSVQQRIFEPFYQVKEQLPTDYIGTGIGLTLVRKLVEMSGGKVTVDSRIDEGSTFYVYLPMSLDTTQELSSPAEEQLPGSENDNNMSFNSDAAKPSIAIVEDNEDMRNFLLTVLASDFQTTGYANAKTALQHLLKTPCDIIISDVMMPEIDGFAFCKTLKEHIATSHIPLVLLTAKNADTDFVRGLDMGADVYLTKPFSPDILKAQLFSLLKNRERVFSMYREHPTERLVPPSGNNIDIEFLNQVNVIIEGNLSNSDLSVQTMLTGLGMSRTAFFLKIKAVSGMTFSDYVKTIRLKKAARLFQEGNTYISEVAYLVGFSSPSYFCNCFKKQFHISPSEFIKGGKHESTDK